MSEPLTEPAPAAAPDPSPEDPPKKRGGGPRTPEGRRRSSLNATKHQLLSRTYIATPEESDAFNSHVASYHEALKPVGLLETELVTFIAIDRWKCRKAFSIETSIFAQGYLDHVQGIDVENSQAAEALAEGKTWIEHAHALSLLNTYDGRISRRADRYIAQLTAMQAQRRESYRHAQREAIKLVTVAESEGVVYEPGGDFLPASAHGEFVYSAPEIARVMDRAARLDRSLDLVRRPPAFPKVA